MELRRLRASEEGGGPAPGRAATAGPPGQHRVLRGRRGFLCPAYNAGVHGANKRAWMCEACERTPAAFACTADAAAAALCVACDVVVQLPTPSPAATCESL